MERPYVCYLFAHSQKSNMTIGSYSEQQSHKFLTSSYQCHWSTSSYEVKTPHTSEWIWRAWKDENMNKKKKGKTCKKPMVPMPKEKNKFCACHKLFPLCHNIDSVWSKQKHISQTYVFRVKKRKEKQYQIQKYYENKIRKLYSYFYSVAFHRINSIGFPMQ